MSVDCVLSLITSWDGLCGQACLYRLPSARRLGQFPLAVCGKTRKFEVLPFRCGGFVGVFTEFAWRQPISGFGSGCRR
jgi:hypothetical protein